MSEQPPAPDGEGEPRTLPSKKDIALWRRAVREKWPITDEMREIIVGDLVDYLINSTSGRDKVNAARALILADSLNVKRGAMIGAAMKAQPQAATNVNVNVGVQVIETDDWYGTKPPSHHVAESNGAPTNGAALPGPIQGGGVWPEMGQNGHRADGDAEGPRGDAGAETGSD